MRFSILKIIEPFILFLITVYNPLLKALSTITSVLLPKISCTAFTYNKAIDFCIIKSALLSRISKSDTLQLPVNIVSSLFGSLLIRHE